MTCPCGDLCNCERNCTCQLEYCNCSICYALLQNVWSRRLSPLSRKPHILKEAKKELSQCLRSEKKVARNQCATFPLIAEEDASASIKVKKYLAFKDPVTRSSSTSLKSSDENELLWSINRHSAISRMHLDPATRSTFFNENKPLSMKSDQAEMSNQEATRRSHLRSLKQTLQKHNAATHGENSEHEQITYLLSTPRKSLFKEREPQSSKKDQAKVSMRETPRRSRFSSLKKKINDFSSRIKETISRNSRYINLVLENRHETYDDETDTSSCGTTSSKRSESPDKENGSTENLFQPSPEIDDVSVTSSQSYRGLEQVLAKSLPPILNETDEEPMTFEKQLCKPIGTLNGCKQGSGSRSSLSPADTLFALPSCFLPLPSKLYSLDAQRSKNNVLSSNNDHQHLKSPEVVKSSVVKLKDHKYGHFMKSRSTSNDGNITVPLASASRAILRSSNGCTKILHTAEVDEGTHFESRASSYGAQKSITADSSEFSKFLKRSAESAESFAYVELNPSAESAESSGEQNTSAESSASGEQNPIHHSYSPSKIPLLTSKSYPLSTRPRHFKTLPRSLSEVPLLEEFESDYEDHNSTEVLASYLASSVLSDAFEALEARSSTDSSESEMSSSFEFLPSSHCRYTTPLISNSIIPYRPLESTDYQCFYYTNK